VNWNRIMHVAGAVVGSALIAVPMLTEVVPGQKLKVASVVLGAALAFITNLNKAAGITVLLLFLLPLQGCALFQKPGVQRVVKCTEDVIATCGAPLLQLTACLDVANPTACVLAVGQAAGCAGKEALVCAVQKAAASPSAMTFMSPTPEEQGVRELRQKHAEQVYSDLGVRPAQ